MAPGFGKSPYQPNGSSARAAEGGNRHGFHLRPANRIGPGSEVVKGTFAPASST